VEVLQKAKRACRSFTTFREVIRRSNVPCGRKRKLKKIATHKRKKKKRKNRHKTRK